MNTVDSKKRNFLYLSATAMTGVGLGYALWPFVKSMNPAADVLAEAFTEVDLSKIKAGEIKTVIWQSKPVFIYHRTPDLIKEVRSVSLRELPDPQSDEERTSKPEWLVVVGVCTHLGCVPNARKDMKEVPGGGWHCPCHGSYYDCSGRIRGGPAPKNLEVPPHDFLTPTSLRIGNV